MSDPIGAIGSRLAALQGLPGGAAGGTFGGQLANQLASQIGGQPGAAVGGPDEARRYTVDIGKGNGAGGAGGPSFGDTLTRAINQVSDAQDTAAELSQKFLRGEAVELHQVMAAGEEAGIALELMIELRNKFTEAYRTLINMQS